MSAAVSKQEKLPARTDVVELAPGVLQTQLPIELPGLGHVNMYVLEDGDGVAVVDPGLPGRATWKAINNRLALIGVPLRRVHTIVVTHSHPDHFGGARRLARESGARIITHASFRMWWDPLEPDDLSPEDLATEMLPENRRAFRDTPWGGDGYDIAWRNRLYYATHRKYPRLFPSVKPTHRVNDGDAVMLAGRRWVAMHTPGHTGDHLCLFDEECGLVISGDHVLPNITPHISGMTLARDPLKRFFASLDKMARLGDTVRLALPAHGNPFHDLAGRCTQIREHHEGRLDKIRSASVDFGRPATVMEIASRVFSARAQGPMADSETYAHLEHLRIAGQMSRRDVDGLARYTVE